MFLTRICSNIYKKNNLDFHSPTKHPPSPSTHTRRTFTIRILVLLLSRMSTLHNNVNGAPSDKRKGTPKQRWTKHMDNVLLPLLADITRSNLKVDKSFKCQAFIEATNIMNRKIPRCLHGRG